MAKVDGGATLWARQTLDSDIFYNKPHVWFKIWFYIVNQVNHKDDRRFKRSLCFMKYEWIMDKTGATKNQVKHCIEFLKKDKMLATRKATRGFIVKVIKYNDYQALDSYKKPQEKESKRNTEGTQKPHSLYKYGKYGKNVIKEKSAIFLKTWKDFKDMRIKKKKPLTDRAEELILKDLDKLSENEKEQIMILNQSIKNCWQGVFPLKNKPQDDEKKLDWKASPAITTAQQERNMQKSTELLASLIGKFDMPKVKEGG